MNQQLNAFARKLFQVPYEIIALDDADRNNVILNRMYEPNTYSTIICRGEVHLDENGCLYRSHQRFNEGQGTATPIVPMMITAIGVGLFIASAIAGYPHHAIASTASIAV